MQHLKSLIGETIHVITKGRYSRKGPSIDEAKITKVGRKYVSIKVKGDVKIVDQLIIPINMERVEPCFEVLTSSFFTIYIFKTRDDLDLYVKLEIHRQLVNEKLREHFDVCSSFKLSDEKLDQIGSILGIE